MTQPNAIQMDEEIVLIVDDVPTNLQVLGGILRDRGYKIAMATNGTQALDLAETLRPAIILLDVMMPGMDGIQVCKKLKANPSLKDIPIIFLTAKTETQDIVAGIEAGAVDYVAKPFNKAELFARLNTHLELRRAHKKNFELGQKNAVLAMALTTNHEINQPLTILKGNFEMFCHALNVSSLPEKQQKFLTKIEEAISRIQNILKKFNEAASIHFEEYTEGKTMVVLDDKKNE